MQTRNTAESRRRSNCWVREPVSYWLAAGVMALAFGLEAAESPLSNGVSTDGTLASGGTNSYSVKANAGDRVVLMTAKLSGGAGFTPVMEVFSPEGGRLAWEVQALAARVDLQAPVSGDYRVDIRDVSGTGGGNYRVRLAQMPGKFVVPAGDDGGALTNGGSHEGTIELGDLDLWTISASAGDRMVLAVSEVSGGAGFAPMIEVFGPGGTLVGAQADGVAARVDVAATTTGTYTVLVSDQGRSGSGSYRLQLAQLPDQFVVPVGDEGGALADATDMDGSIVLGDLDWWSFTASAGDLVTLQITELSGGAGFAPQIELFTASGEGKAAAHGASGATVEAAIESTGTYAVLVSDSDERGAGTYRLRLTRSSIIVPPESNRLTNGASLLGSIGVVGQTNRWSFSASSGESLVVRAGETTTGAFVPWVRLYSPGGVLLSQSFNAAASEVVARATNSGTFVVLVSDGSSGRNQVGDYRITLAKTGSALAISPSDEGGALVNGNLYVATLEVGDIDAWSFTANLGENIIVRMGETTAGSVLYPWLRLYGPSGALLGEDYNQAAAEVNVRATNSGTFLVVVGDGNSGIGGSGNYRINLAKTGSQLAISPSDEGGPVVNGTTYLATIDVGDIDAWTFTANAGEAIVVWVGETAVSSPLYPWLRLYGPNGALLNQDFNQAAAEVNVRATNSGTFLVVVGDGNSGIGGSGNYRINLAKTGSQSAVSPSDEGGAVVNGTTYLAMIDVGDIDAWTFTANAGDTIVARVGETTASSPLYPWLRLYGPSGALLSEDYNQAAAEVTARATNSGTFLVVVGDGNSGRGGSGNYRLSLAMTGSPLTISSTDEGGSLVNGSTYVAAIEVGDLDGWSFTANAGDNILVRMGEMTAGSELYPWLRLYGPNGALLNQDFNQAAAEVSVRATNSGTFLVVAGDGNSGRGGSGNYRISLARSGGTLNISAGDEGGSMTGTGSYVGAIETGDMDVWAFTGCAGDVISVTVTESVSGSALYPWLRLYSKDGVRLGNVFGPGTAGFANFVAPSSGTFQVVVADGNSGIGGSGTYTLTVNGLSDGLKLCPPNISGTNAVVTGIGGNEGGTFLLLTSTDLAVPLNQWSAIATNQFDQFGVMSMTNLFSLDEPKRFFTLQLR